MNKSLKKRLSNANRFFARVTKNPKFHGAKLIAEPSDHRCECDYGDYIAVCFYCKDFSVNTILDARGKTGFYCYPSAFGFEIHAFVTF